MSISSEKKILLKAFTLVRNTYWSLEIYCTGGPEQKYSISHVSLDIPKWNAHVLVTHGFLLRDKNSPVPQVLKSAGSPSSLLPFPQGKMKNIMRERFGWEQSRGFGRRSKLFLHASSKSATTIPPFLLLPPEGGVDFEAACGKAWKEKGEHRKRLWKSVYLGPRCSRTKPGTLDLLNHRSDVFPTCRPLNCVTASVLLRLTWYSL